MFENVLGQSAAAQLAEDIEAGILAPAMLFSGPPACGKGTAALELGRVISCEAVSPNETMHGRAPWGCKCASCSRHRLLIHPDMICLGPRPFSAEIAASAGAFLREPAIPQAGANNPSLILFIRAVRKLLARFNPALWEDEPKKGKTAAAPLVNSLEEDIDELGSLISESQERAPDKNREALAKLCNGILKSAFKLESEGLSETIPIDRIRRAAWWGRLAPAGNGKLLVIENADRTQEEARNSLLKLLEEPPARLTIVLTSSRPGSLLPTILSRLRPYRFNARDAAVEADVIRRVFRDTQEGGIGAYLDSFLPVSAGALNDLATFFAASVARKAALLSKRQGRAISNEAVLLGKFAAPKAEAAGLGRPQGEAAAVIPLILEKADKFEIRSLFSRFLRSLLDIVSQSQRQSEPDAAGNIAGRNFADLPSVAYNEVWKNCCAWGERAVGVYRLSPNLVLEKLFADLSRGMSEL
ncbi:MAG: DNA polymerase III [Treponema sp.]|nr:DNA polymerase III [Treponema sp.]